jgi:general L-amino acid transport system substrate-binding protein
MFRRSVRLIASAALIGAAIACSSAGQSAFADDSITRIRARGYLGCGLPDDRPGFAVLHAEDEAEGFDTDFCRALGAAILGAADKVKFIKVDRAEEFLRRPEVDVVFHGLTWNFTRELTSGLSFGPVTFHDGQTFLVRKESAATSIAQLARPSICVEAGTSFARALAGLVRARSLDARSVLTDNAATARELFFAGECDALTADASMLLAVVAGRNAERYRILPDLMTKEPLAPVVRRGDDQLLAALRWTIYATIAAEEADLTSKTADEPPAGGSTAPAVLLDLPASAALGLEPKWTYRVVRSVGNYGEIFARNFTGRNRPDMPRGLNRLWNAGGLLYAPPFR